MSSRSALPASHCQLRRVDNVPSCLGNRSVGNGSASYVLPALPAGRRAGIHMTQAGAVQTATSTPNYGEL